MIHQLAKGRFICHSCRVTFVTHSNRNISTHLSKNLPQNQGKLRSARNVPTHPARTRFAPSPTGNLHLGSLRTALYNYLIARRTGGQFILRIEDTDAKRTISGAEERIYEDLRWAGLDWDEGPEIGGPYGPYRQSERKGLYKAHADRLLDSGHAYRCFCEQATLRARFDATGEGGYNRHCYHISKEESDGRAHQGQPFVVRLKAADTPYKFKDLTYGTVVQPKADNYHGTFRDPILVKADGLPTYHFANVVDDHFMQITHVIRGVEWLISTPLHIELYKAFNWEEPVFCHVSLLLDEDRHKLSKRDKSFDMSQLKYDGVLPEALSNFLVLQGWSHPDKSDWKTLRQLESEFTLKFSKGNPIVSVRKLDFLSPKHAVKRVQDGGKSYEEMLDLVMNHVRILCNKNANNLVPAMSQSKKSQRKYVDDILRLDAKNYKNAADYVATHTYFFLNRPKSPVTLSQNHNLTEAKIAWDQQEQKLKNKLFDCLAPHLSSSASWSHDTISKAIAEVQDFLVAEPVAPIPENGGIRFVQNWVWEYIRAYICFGEKGPSVVDAMAILGGEVVKDRIKNLKVIRGDEPEPVEPSHYEKDAE